MLLMRGKTFAAIAVSGALTWGLLAPAADADVMWAYDDPDDVVQVHRDPDTGEYEQATLFDRPMSDITRLKASHRRYRVKARLDLANLERDIDIWQYYTFRFKTDSKRFKIDYVYFTPSRRSSDSPRLLERGSSSRGYKDVECDDLTLEANYDKNFIRWSLPRKCIGRPTWVRMGADTRQDPDDFSTSYDHALTTGEAVDQWTRSEALGPRLRRSDAATTIGTNGDDTIGGDERSDTIKARGGHDELHGGEGPDALHGGSGNDLLFGDDGANTHYGGDGEDTVLGGNGDEVLYGGRGADSLLPAGGEDTVRAGRGDDRVAYSSDGDDGQRDIIDCGPGDDVVDTYHSSELDPNDQFIDCETFVNG